MDVDAITGPGITMPLVAIVFASFYVGLVVSSLVVGSPSVELLASGVLRGTERVRAGFVAGLVWISLMTLVAMAIVSLHLLSSDFAAANLWFGLFRVYCGNCISFGLGAALGAWVPALPAWAIAIVSQFVLPGLWLQYLRVHESALVEGLGLVLRILAGQYLLVVPVAVFNRIEMHPLIEVVLLSLYTVCLIYLAMEAVGLRLERSRRKGR
jgi:hypothetical protein